MTNLIHLESSKIYYLKFKISFSEFMNAFETLTTISLSILKGYRCNVGGQEFRTVVSQLSSYSNE